MGPGAKARLKRPQFDPIDIYRIHGFDPAAAIEETVPALDVLVPHGCVRHVGVPNRVALRIVKRLGIGGAWASPAPRHRRPVARSPDAAG